MCLHPGDVYYNYVKYELSSLGSLNGSALPSFLFLIFNIQQLVISPSLWGIHFASPAILLMKTWQTDKQGQPQLAQRSKGHTPLPACAFVLRSSLLTLATFINVIGDLQILGALAGLLFGIAYRAGKTTFQCILALVTKLFRATTGIICEYCNRRYMH